MGNTRMDYERQFRRAGLPLFIEGYSARRDVFTRARPLLALVLFAEVLGALNLEWSAPANVAAILGGSAILLAGLVLVNRLRERPALALPARVGGVELAAFVLLPSALPVVFGGQETSALVTALANVALLVAVYLVVGYAVLSILRWAVSRLARQLAGSLLLLARAVPLLLLFAMVLFITTETWQTFGGLTDVQLAFFAALLLGVEWMFLAARLPREVRALEREAGAGLPLGRRQRLNVGLVMYISQALQVLLVSLAVGVFFTVMATIIISPELLREWLGYEPDELAQLKLAGLDARLTAEHLRVTTALAALSALYYSIAMLTDPTYRDEFLAEITDELGASFTARAEYLAALARRTG